MDDAIKDISSRISDAARDARALTTMANDAIARGDWKEAAKAHEKRDAALGRSERLSRMRDRWAAAQ